MVPKPPPRKPRVAKPAAFDPQANTFGTGQKFAQQAVNDMGGKLTETLRNETALINQKVDLRMNGLEKELLAKLENKPSNGALLTHTIATIGIIITVILTTLAIGGSTFSGGMSASGAFASQIVEREQRDAELKERLEGLSKQVEALGKQQQKALEAPSGPKPK